MDRPDLDLRDSARANLPDLRDLPALSEEERAMAARTWKGRMVNEHVSAQVFGALIGQGMRAGLPSWVLAGFARAASDELRHGDLCAGVVLALGGEPVATYPELEEVPTHPEVGPREAVLRNVLSVCCLSETVAVSVIRAEQAELEGSALGGLLNGILADEVNHARLGWTLVGRLRGELDGPTRERLTLYLVDALKHQVLYEVPRLPVNAGLRPEIARAGVCDGGLAREIFFATVEEGIVPQLELVGLGGRAAWRQARAELGLA